MDHVTSSMVQAGGVTYRISPRDTLLDVIRLADDRRVGIVRYEPMLTVVQAQIRPCELLEIGRVALHRCVVNRTPRAPRSVPVTDGGYERFAFGYERFASAWLILLAFFLRVGAAIVAVFAVSAVVAPGAHAGRRV